MSRLGSIGTQYFDGAGNPLIDGKLYIYESGTTTPKTTYADSSLTIANTNPVILTGDGRQPNVWFDGTAKIILTGSDDVQIEVRDPIGGAISGEFDSWSSVTIYGLNNIVEGSDGNFYKSISSSNVGNDPTTNTTNWTRVQFTETWNTNNTYTIDDIVQGSDGKLYVAITSSNTGNDPISDVVNWIPVGSEPDLVLLSSVTLSTDTSVDFTFPTGYTSFILKMLNVVGSTSASKRIRTSNDGGSTFDAGGNDYRYTNLIQEDTSSTLLSSRAIGSTAIVFGNTGGELCADITIFDPRALERTLINIQESLFYSATSILRVSTGGGMRVTAQSVDAIRVDAGAGTLDTGIINLYGVV